MNNSITSYNHNLRVNYNSIGVNYLTSGTHKKHLKGSDLIDKSKQYKNSIKIASTYTKTHYVKYNKKTLKLKSLVTILKHDKIKFVISSDYRFITIFNSDNSYNTYNIIYSNGALVKGAKKDYKVARKLYNY